MILVDQDGNVVERPSSEPEKSAASDSEDLDAVTSSPRLTGPGAKAARVKHEPRMDKATLGRERRPR